MTAERSSAYSVATDYLGLISYTDLSELDPSLEYSRKVFYQLSEIDPAVGSKVKEDLVVVECILCIYEFHLKVVLLDLLKADLKCFFFFFTVFFFLFVILGAGCSKNGL